MTDPPVTPENHKDRQSAWSPPVSRIKVSGAPAGVKNLNVEGRQLVSPLQGFGQMWQKTFKVRLSGVNMTPVEVMQIWKEKFQNFQPLLALANYSERFVLPTVGRMDEISPYIKQGSCGYP